MEERDFQRLFKNNLVFWPTLPKPVEKESPSQTIPFSHWNAFTALAVREPKYVVSFPGEPGPEGAIALPSPFRTFWRLVTSSPISPYLSVRFNPVSDALSSAKTGEIENKKIE